jgi:hypothetical protein
MVDSGDEGENTATYKSCKSKNEMDPDLYYQTGPEELKLDDLDEIIPFGHVVQYISQGIGMCLIKPLDASTLYNLDNIICLEDRTAVGFVFELVGPVSMPLYNVTFYPSFVDKLLLEA